MKNARLMAAVISLFSLLLIPAVHACTVTVSPATVTLSSGGTQVFSATTTPASCGQGVTWSATAGTITQLTTSSASFKAPLVTVITTVTVKASRNTMVFGTATVTVDPPTLQTISVTPAFNMLTIPNTTQLTATGNYSDGTQQNLTSTAVWTSSSSSTASVNAGLVTAVADGDTNITATASGVNSNMAEVDVGTAANFYIATNGNDSWSGTLFEPNQAGTDGPLATVCMARQKVQPLLTGSNPISVLVRGGTYYITGSTWESACGAGTYPPVINFTSADGSATAHVTYQNYPGETPVLSGGLVISNWQSNGTVGNGVSQYKATLSQSPTPVYSENLFYTLTGSTVGHRRLRPRIVEVGGNNLGTYLRLTVVTKPNNTSDPNCVLPFGSVYECTDRIQYASGDPITNTWANLSPPTSNPCSASHNSYPVGDISLLIFEYWDVSKMLINCVDTTNRIIYFTTTVSPQKTNANQSPVNGHRYLVENVKDALTLPGQFFLDRSVTPWTLYYNANAGENPTNGTDLVVLPQSPQILVAKGLQNVTFKGITFEHDNFTVPQYVSSTQPGSYQSLRQDTGISTAVSCQGCKNVTFDSDIVTQASGGGVEIVSTTANPTSTGDFVQNSAMYDVGGMGIRVGVPVQSTDTLSNIPNNISVTNNLVEGYGRVIPSSIAVVQGNANTNTYSNNELYDGYHSGIEICALSCPIQNGQLGTFDITTSYNLIHDIGLGITDDMGGIYFNLDPTSTGNQILNNVVHDVTDDSAIGDTDGYGGQGLYIDNVTTDMTVKNNLVYRISASTQAQTCGATTAGQPTNTIQNNIFACGRKGIKQEGCSTGSSSVKQFIFENNLVWFDMGSIQTGSADCYNATGNACTGMTNIQDYVSNMYCYGPGTNCALPTNEFYTQDINNNVNRYATFAAWQAIGEDSGSLIQNPFPTPTSCSGNFNLTNHNPGVGFMWFDPTQAGRQNPTITGPTVPETFLTQLYSSF